MGTSNLRALAGRPTRGRFPTILFFSIFCILHLRAHATHHSTGNPPEKQKGTRKLHDRKRFEKIQITESLEENYKKKVFKIVCTKIWSTFLKKKL
jgi:hypothetical protein